MNYVWVVLTGAILPMMVKVNGMLAQQIGQLAANFWIHFCGLLFILPFVKWRKLKAKVMLMTGGLFGGLTVLFSNVALTTMSITLFMALSLLSQVATSLYFERKNGIHWRSIGFIIIGVMFLGGEAIWNG